MSSNTIENIRVALCTAEDKMIYAKLKIKISVFFETSVLTFSLNIVFNKSVALKCKQIEEYRSI